METRKFIDSFGDDVFAFALVVTKSYDSAKMVFLKTALCADKYDSLGGFIAAAFEECRSADSNEEATTFSGEGLSEKQEALLGLVLTKPQILRAMVHMFYENDMDAASIAKALGMSERHVIQQLESLGELNGALEKGYKDICTHLCAQDSLKEYAIKAAETGDGRLFAVKREAVAQHKWSKLSKAVIIAVAVAAVFVGMFVIPLTEMYKKMQEDLFGISYEEPATDEIFRYTYESDESEQTSCGVTDETSEQKIE